ncbi:VWA domain-containing protein [Nocardia sp. CA2R105]|uniref:VWA domain-containing protein n=1 Tax=Nocardia coffeae TaxID=2873381 RepID=UPI001CA6DF1D|nr:VWA domain-containing protein [Nocardia coffeae]MBY8862407.1 VWA domain-containing protein [Nocardia coffeae]
MEATVHRFANILRRWGIRVSAAEMADAMRGAAQPGVLADRETLRWTLRAALIKDQRDDELFGDLFDVYFALLDAEPAAPSTATAATAELTGADESAMPTADPASFELAEEAAAATPGDGARPEDVRHLFDTEQLGRRFNLSQDDGMIDLSAPSEEIAFSQGNQVVGADGYRLQFDARRLHTGAAPGQLSGGAGAEVDLRLGSADQQALLEWLGAPEDLDAAAAREQACLLGDLPAALRRHAESLLRLRRRDHEAGPRRGADLPYLGAAERLELEQALRRIARSLRGAPTHRRRVARAGRVDAARTMRRCRRFDGVPFAPVTVRRAQDRPRLLVLADVSLSVRATAHFTLHLVHSMQDVFAQVRSFAFVAETAEITGLLAEDGGGRALGALFGGDLLDTDANSDYGAVFRALLAEHSGALTRRTTLLVLGDGRGNGNDPGLAEFEEITRRVRETVWLTPEPRYSWRLGSCDMAAYAERCDRVSVVRGLRELVDVAELLDAAVG